MQGHVIGQQPVRISWSKNPGQVNFFCYNLYWRDVEPHFTRWFIQCGWWSLVFVIGWLRHTSRSKSVECVLRLRTRLWRLCLWGCSRPILVCIWWIWLSPVSATGRELKVNIYIFVICGYLCFMVEIYSGWGYTRNYKLCCWWSCWGRTRVIWSYGHSWCRKVKFPFTFLHVST